MPRSQLVWKRVNQSATLASVSGGQTRNATTPRMIASAVMTAATPAVRYSPVQHESSACVYDALRCMAFLPSLVDESRM